MPTVTRGIRRQGQSLAITLPKAMTDALELCAGDEVDIALTTDGIVVRRHDATFAKAMEAADWVFQRYGNALKALSDE